MRTIAAIGFVAVVAWLSPMPMSALADSAVPSVRTLPHPGELFFNIEEQRIKGDNAACDGPLHRVPFILEEKPVLNVGWTHGDEPPGNDFSVLEFIRAAYLTRSPDRGPLPAAKNLLLSWAKADAMQKFRSNDSGTWWAAYLVLGSGLEMYNMLDAQHELSADEKKLVFAWLTHLMQRTYIGRELPRGTAGYRDVEQRVNNHNARRNMLAALWAVETNQPKMFNAAIKNGYVRFLENIRADGSIYDANRGIWAMRYTSFDIGAALFLAQVAAHQGVDLYDLEVHGRTIHTAVKFLLDANDDESLINKYAKQDIGMKGMPFNGHQEISWKRTANTVMAYIGWIELYLKLFPDNENAPRLRALRKEYVTSTGTPYLFDWSFGNVSCFWGPGAAAP